MTNRVLSWFSKHGVDPASILILTFTRLATAQLKQEVAKVLEPLGKGLPNVATLHSFALTQILHNSGKVDSLPAPIRIADDWEERHIIQEDLKRALAVKEIGEVQELIQQLSTDWETLRADEQGWQEQFPNAKFIGAWQQHRAAFGYTLRAELVYQLKRSLNQNPNFALNAQYKHVLIDEYQDLNACDLAIVHELANQKAELFVAGDDDQSIYGFRYADPVGIRQFAEVFPNTEKLALEICFRCDKSILAAATFVADLDPKRLPKPTKARDGAGDGSVRLLSFVNQHSETTFVVDEIAKLVKDKDAPVSPGKIAVLLRGDKNGALSKGLIEGLEKAGVKVSQALESEIENSRPYRIALSYLRLLVDVNDSLAQRTLLQEAKNGIGETAIEGMLSRAKEKGQRFAEITAELTASPDVLPKFGKKVSERWGLVLKQLEEIKALGSLAEQLNVAMQYAVPTDTERVQVMAYFEALMASHLPQTIQDLVRMTTVLDQEIEQDTAGGCS